MVKIYLGADHAGFKLKEEIKQTLSFGNIKFEDLTPNYKEGDDYPDVALLVAEKIVEEKNGRGILICGSGIGMSIVANKVPGVRAALVSNSDQLDLSRRHNDANILVLSGWWCKDCDLSMIKSWFFTHFEGGSGKHQARVNKIKRIEEKYSKTSS